MKYVLAGDLGGTNSRLALAAIEDRNVSIVKARDYAAKEFSGFDSILENFVKEHLDAHQVEHSCFAVAGPVQGRRAGLTNLPWQLDCDRLQENFSIGGVSLVNDFVANGYSLDVLGENDLLTLQAGENVQGNRAVLGAGTGLGMALVSGHDETLQVRPSEGGHMDFAPLDDETENLLRFLRQETGRISYEHVLSGPGLVRIYRYHAWREGREIDTVLQERDVPAAITRMALQQQDPLARRSLDMFMRIYGSCAANLALVGLASGGVYLAGGIAAKLPQVIADSDFLDYFNNKAPMSHLLQAIPVRLITNAGAGLLGAAWYAGCQ